MKFNSQICTTKEQSERLLNLGLKKETADMVHQISGIGAYKCWYKQDIEDDFYPAWSLDRLIDMLEDYKIDLYTGLNRYDEAIALIQSLIHIDGFNKEYLIDKE